MRKVGLTEKRAIKSKFNGFNSAIEERYEAQRYFCIPDFELRKQIIDDIKNCILPLYNNMLERYSSIPFSSNPSKYIRYSNQTLTQLFDKFFEAEGKQNKFQKLNRAIKATTKEIIK
eukprot:TRINITY_DN2997_c0_g4_i1.p1 TRINITY_DN2997_c0_g4~~TRINITY_DN2997_c0_g4_i1.p1  ORF type:complete len:117 (-),score=34.03 TRINITY_DN2997_c0_g4_i1:116-466(-)